jgi:hypothetical protein
MPVNEVTLIGIVLGLIMMGIVARRRRPRTSETLQRLHPGVAHKAEWMASETTVQRVTADYLAAQQWVGDMQLADCFACLREVGRYFSGALLRDHQKMLARQLAQSRVRLVGVLRAHHQITVRRFSDDGLSCLLIDRQSERRMATYNYWTKQRVHTQDLGGGALVYRMMFDRATGRWKIDEFIQQLPIGWETLPGSTLRITDALPEAAGRDI